MGCSVRLSVAERDNAAQLLPFCNRISVFYFGVWHCHPAAVKSELCRQKYKLFAAISAYFVQLIVFSAYKSNIIGNARELAVMRHKAVESLRLICYKLYVKSAFGIQQVYLFSELIRYFFWYLFFGIVGSYGVAILHCGYNIRHKFLLTGLLS